MENLQPAVIPDQPIHDYDFGAGMLIVPLTTDMRQLGAYETQSTHIRALVTILNNQFCFKVIEGTQQEIEAADMAGITAEFIQELAAQGIKYPFEQ